MKHGSVFWHPAVRESWALGQRPSRARWIKLRRPRLRDGLKMSFAVFFIAMAACVAIEPEAARDNNGVSYFDHVSYALIPYVVGVVAIAATAVLVARGLPAHHPPESILRTTLFVIAALLVLIVLTPDYVNDWFNWAHVTVSVALFGVSSRSSPGLRCGFGETRSISSRSCF